MSAPSPFSTNIPKLQLVWDATSLSALQFCPRYYQYTILEGWRGKGAVDLDFGAYFATGVETYKRERLQGKTKDEAELIALKRVVEASWVEGPCSHCDPEGTCVEGCGTQQGHPWGGSYEELWHCTGEKPYKNSKGNKAKCPWAHKGKWFPSPAPSVCGECGSSTIVEKQYVPIDTKKNRHSLVRALVWYIEDQPDAFDGAGLHPFKFKDGTPAIELSFKLPLPWKSLGGEPFVMAGHIDSIMANGNETELFISDNKTTGKWLGKQFFDGYSPNTQLDTYDFVGSVLYQDLPIRGNMVEGTQLLSGGAKFGSMLYYHTEEQRVEYMEELHEWLFLAEHFALKGYWPMNRRNCWLCPFKGICNKPASERERYLKADFDKRFWNPLEER